MVLVTGSVPSGPTPRCLEVFARNLRRGWTSVGNEVLKYQQIGVDYESKSVSKADSLSPSVAQPEVVHWHRQMPTSASREPVAVLPVPVPFPAPQILSVERDASDPSAVIVAPVLVDPGSGTHTFLKKT